MPTLIIFGIVALIVIILLVVFNVRTASQHRKKAQQKEAPPPEAAPDQAAAEKQAHEAPPRIQEELPAAKPAASPVMHEEHARPKPADRTDKHGEPSLNDSGYRNALRQFQSQTPQKAPTPKPAKAAGKADAQFRDALRSMQKQASVTPAQANKEAEPSGSGPGKP